MPATPEADEGDDVASCPLALGEFVAIIFSINGSILGGVMSKINRDK